MTGFRALARRSVLGAVAALGVARVAPAQIRSCAPLSGDSASATARWLAPLDRALTLHVNGVSLRDALDRVAALVKVRLSYSAAFLPLDRVVCLAADAAPVGRVIADLLKGTNVAPVAVGDDQVVLAPRAATAERAAAPQMASSVGVLDRVVVTGNAVGGSERDLTVGLDVISGRQLARDNASSVSSALDGYVPGMWAWAQSPANALSSYASIRGASSFGLSYPKIYIDGIEVANPLLITRFTPDAIERIEVIRGPQGSALYGTDAISGVINIVTRHEGLGSDGERASVRTTAGVTQSAFAHGVVSQDHEVALISGTSTRSADLHVSGSSMGSFIPDGYSRDLLASGSARLVGGTTTLSATGRFFMQQAGSASSPLITRPTLPAEDSIERTLALPTSPQSIQEYTLGSTATFSGGDRWTHSAVVGIDGYRLSNVQTNLTPIPSVADSALHAAQGGADRATFRASSVLHLDHGDSERATLTFEAEQGVFRGTSASYGTEPMSMAIRPVMPEPHAATPQTVSQQLVTWQTNTGFTTQANAALGNTFFATGGFRIEHDSRLAGSQLAMLPMLGVAEVRDYGPLSVKFRAAYGEGIRPPSTPAHLDFWRNAYDVGAAAQGNLGAERQAGVESGVDLLFQQAFSFRVTRFDQYASGLIQEVGVPDSGPESHRLRYELENLGEIANRGWELESGAHISRLSVTGTLAFVSSTVQNVAAGYKGDLAVGDRMLQVPATTGSLNLSWLGQGWGATLGGSRAIDWINYDQLALAHDYASGAHFGYELSGAQLRQYWRRYNGGLRIRAAASRDIRDVFTLEASVDNLLNYQRDEPDNITVLPGRTLMTGVRLRF